MLKTLTLLAGLVCGQVGGQPLTDSQPQPGIPPRLNALQPGATMPNPAYRQPARKRAPVNYAPSPAAPAPAASGFGAPVATPTVPANDAPSLPPVGFGAPVESPAVAPAAPPSSATPTGVSESTRRRPWVPLFGASRQDDKKEPDEKKGEEKKEEETPAAAETPAAPAAVEAPAAAAAPAGDRWFLMKALQGTYPGNLMIDSRIQIWGWTTASFTPSTSTVDNNQPVVWNDRADRFLLNQDWTRIERTVVTSGTTSPTWGFRVDLLYGSDYRYTIPRGLFNAQLENSRGNQNLYGFDPIAHYLEFYFPTLFQGTDLKLGRFFTPFGYESLETISSPLVSKSYSFNWFPPFTHFGALATTTFSPVWKAQYGIINGNDVYIGDPSEEPRFLGTVTYTSPNLRDVVTFGTSVGRGKINNGDTYNPATFGLQSEPAGRANFNAFDLVWTHVITPRINYALEADYAYQYGVPAGGRPGTPTNVPGGIIRGYGDGTANTTGTAHWGGVAQYLLVNLTPKLTQITRFELWDDIDGQRTGFTGLYIAPTVGLVYKPYPWLWWRQELRYDYNPVSRAFNNAQGGVPSSGSHDQFTAGMDWTIRW